MDARTQSIGPMQIFANQLRAGWGCETLVLEASEQANP
jgi:hypothetical protein